jgi:hypothetical protein
MQRREFIAAVAGAAAGWPLADPVEQPAVPVMHNLCAGPAKASAKLAMFNRCSLAPTR